MHEDKRIVYSPERYGGKITLDVVRRKGSSGTVSVTWAVFLDLQTPISFVGFPLWGKIEFTEGQWNSTIQLRFPFVPSINKEIVMSVELVDISEGALLGNFTSVAVVFPPAIGDGGVVTPGK